MNNKKKKLAFIGLFAAVLAASLGVSVTLTYLGTNEGKKNTITVGHGDQQISEQFSEPSEATMEGSYVEKKFSVENTGTVPSFVRLYAEFSDSEVADKATVKYTVDNTTTEYTWKKFKEGLALTDPNADGYIESDWRYIPESAENGLLGGYFYYTKALGARTVDNNNYVYDKTPNLFDSVKVDFQEYSKNDQNVMVVVDSSNIDRIKSYEMIVYSETVQNVETGAKVFTSTVNEETSTWTEYGYEYKDSEWKEAWKSFLRQTP